MSGKHQLDGSGSFLYMVVNFAALPRGTSTHKGQRKITYTIGRQEGGCGLRRHALQLDIGALAETATLVLWACGGRQLHGLILPWQKSCSPLWQLASP
jgi:hypothetical protein